MKSIIGIGLLIAVVAFINYRQQSRKSSVTIDGLLFFIICGIAGICALQFVAACEGTRVEIIPDTVDSSRNWPHAGGRVRVRSYDWWGLKRADYIAEAQYFVDRDHDSAEQEWRWMIIDDTGPREDRYGRKRFPRPLFYEEDFNSYFSFDGTAEQWFQFRRLVNPTVK
jgi:hypothetical protein